MDDEIKNQLIISAHEFMRTLTEAYGADAGMILWDKISSVIDPVLKGEIFFAMLTGKNTNQITVRGMAANAQAHVDRIGMIRCIRNHTAMGLREAKDISDACIQHTYPVLIDVMPRNRNALVRELQLFGCII